MKRRGAWRGSGRQPAIRAARRGKVRCRSARGESHRAEARRAGGSMAGQQQRAGRRPLPLRCQRRIRAGSAGGRQPLFRQRSAQSISRCGRPRDIRAGRQQAKIWRAKAAPLFHVNILNAEARLDISRYSAALICPTPPRCALWAPPRCASMPCRSATMPTPFPSSIPTKASSCCSVNRRRQLWLGRNAPF